MTIPAATPGGPTVTVEHGPGALVLTVRDDAPGNRCPHCHRPPQLGTVLSPDGADRLAYELSTQAAAARLALDRHNARR